ncbi:hypothetical protein MRX96_010135 [Rhipicephalus microplus]
MESTALAGDAQDYAAYSRTMDVQHDDDESLANTESEEGWHTVYYGRRRKPGHESVKGTLMASMVLTTRDNGPDYENIKGKAHLHQEDVHESARHRDPENDSKQDPAPVQGTTALQAPTPVPGRDRRLRDQQTR